MTRKVTNNDRLNTYYFEKGMVYARKLSKAEIKFHEKEYGKFLYSVKGTH